MSHDQRPGKMRVVGNAASAETQRRRNDPVTIEGTAETVSTDAVAATSAATPDKGLPLMPAMLFLLACIGGGIAVAVLRPFGLG